MCESVLVVSDRRIFSVEIDISKVGLLLAIFQKLHENKQLLQPAKNGNNFQYQSSNWNICDNINTNYGEFYDFTKFSHRFL